MFNLEEYRDLGPLVKDMKTFDGSLLYIENELNELDDLPGDLAYTDNFVLVISYTANIQKGINTLTWDEFIHQKHGKYIIIRHTDTSYGMTKQWASTIQFHRVESITKFFYKIKIYY